MTYPKPKIRFNVEISNEQYKELMVRVDKAKEKGLCTSRNQYIIKKILS